MSLMQARTAQHSTSQHITAQHSTAQHSTAQHSTAQHSTAQHSMCSHCTSTEPAADKASIFTKLCSLVNLRWCCLMKTSSHEDLSMECHMFVPWLSSKLLSCHSSIHCLPSFGFVACLVKLACLCLYISVPVFHPAGFKGYYCYST